MVPRSKEEKYWNDRYSKQRIPFTLRGTSGAGSIGEMREWKWRIIRQYLPIVNHVIDFGCGDLSFWYNKPCSDYIGLDISKRILERNKKKFKRKFIYWDQDSIIENLERPTVLCIDVLFHILDEKIFIKTLINICRCSTEFIFISTWKDNPMYPEVTDREHQYYRSLEEFIYIFEMYGFKLLGVHTHTNGINAMYVLKIM